MLAAALRRFVMLFVLASTLTAAASLLLGLAFGAILFALALRHARRTGSLSQY